MKGGWEYVDSMWESVRNKCLDKAGVVLDSETVPTAATVETVKALVEAAGLIELLNLRRQEQNRSCAAGHLGSASRPKAKEN